MIENFLPEIDLRFFLRNGFGICVMYVPVSDPRVFFSNS